MLIGGTASGDANTIGFNTNAGVEIDDGSVNNVVLGNYIGTNSSKSNLGNSIGVMFAADSGSNNTIGGTTTAAANTIGFNTTAGIQLLSTSGTGNVVAGNLIGTDGNVGDNLNNQIGIQISGSPGNTIGGTATGTANVIGLNSTAGVQITGATALANLVAGNFIGTNSTDVHLGNGVGVLLISGASNNTIGGSSTGAGNTIGFNSSDGVQVNGASTTGDVISENLIFANTGLGINLVGGGNNFQPMPTIVAVTSVPGLTTIDGLITGPAAGTYTVEFFASTAGGVGPASQFLGSTTVSLPGAGSQFFTAALNISVLQTGQSVTATVTSPATASAPNANNTSEFATAASLSNPFIVTQTSDGVLGHAVGSLRQAIIDANTDPGTPITFYIATGPFVISPTSSLPTITVPVTINGKTQPGVEISGGGQSFNGLTLGAGSNGSTIEGLDIADFAGAGISIQSSNDVISGNFLGTDLTGLAAGPGNTSGVSIIKGSNNTIGGTASGAANTIGFNTQNGVAVISGIGNEINENLYVGTNGTATPTEANDITLSPNANNNQAAPTLISATLSGNQLSALFTANVPTWIPRSPSISTLSTPPPAPSSECSRSMEA